MTARKDLRDWQPGDGLTCHLAKASPIPCGRPTQTYELIAPGRGGDSVRKYPKCALHAAAHVSGKTIGALQSLAKRRAYERLAHEHWDEFQRYSDELMTQYIQDLTKGGETA